MIFQAYNRNPNELPLPIRPGSWESVFLYIANMIQKHHVMQLRL